MVRSVVITVVSAALGVAWMVGVAGPSVAATTYTVTTTPVTHVLSWQERTQTGTGGGELTVAPFWTGTMRWEPTGSCVGAGTPPPSQWQANIDLSQYHFNSVSAVGVQRRKCNATTAGPNASNADCLPADCDMKVIFANAVYHAAQYAPTYPVYSAWESRTQEFETADAAQLALQSCAQDTMLKQACSRQAVSHPDRSVTMTGQATCPAATLEMSVACTQESRSEPAATQAAHAGQAGQGAQVTPKHRSKKRRPTMSVRQAPSRINVRLRHAAGDVVALELRHGRTWRLEVQAVVPDNAVVWHRNVRGGTWRVVLLDPRGGRLATSHRLVFRRR